MTGDASGFVDPVFSSGVYLALVSGIMAGKSVSQSNGVQKGGASFSPMVRKAYTMRIHRNADTFLPLIRAYYDDSAFEVFMNPVANWGLSQAINHLVSGKLDVSLVDRIRYRAFLLLCWIQRYFALAPRIKWDTP